MSLKKRSHIFSLLFSAVRGSWDFIFGRIGLIHLLEWKKIGSSKFSVFIFFLMVIGFLVCVCGGTEIAGILVCSTFAEALGQELVVKIHRKV